MRLFFAVPLAEALRDAACGIQESLAASCPDGPRVKWVERPNLHLTLKFIGDIPADQMDRVCSIAQDVAEQGSPASISVCGAGSFPPRGAPRVIWVGLDEECPELTELAERLDRALQEAGLAEPDRHPFTAHFTLGRVKDRRGGRELRETIEGLADEPVGEMPFERFSLMSSQLTSRGAVYTEREQFDLS